MSDARPQPIEPSAAKGRGYAKSYLTEPDPEWVPIARHPSGWPYEVRDDQRAKPGTTCSALDGERMIYFTDCVREGEIVNVFSSETAAYLERGYHKPMLVCHDGENWWLVDV